MDAASRGETLKEYHLDGADAEIEHAGHRQILSNRHAALQCIRYALEAVANQHRNDCHQAQGCCGAQKAYQLSHLLSR